MSAEGDKEEEYKEQVMRKKRGGNVFYYTDVLPSELLQEEAGVAKQSLHEEFCCGICSVKYCLVPE